MTNHEHYPHGYQAACPFCVLERIEDLKRRKIAEEQALQEINVALESVKATNYIFNLLFPSLKPPQQQKEITVVPSSVEELIERGKV
jgi:hypothetical protein